MTIHERGIPFKQPIWTDDTRFWTLLKSSWSTGIMGEGRIQYRSNSWLMDMNGIHLFPECVAKGSRFTLGVGLRRCLCVRNRSQPSANVPQWPSWGQYSRASGEFCKSGHFWHFKRRVASFRVAGVAPWDNPTCFITCRNMHTLHSKLHT